RKQQKWADLADVIKAHGEIERDLATRVGLLIDLGDLYETQLASTAKASEAYQQALDLDENSDDAAGALERLYRRDETWASLARVLDLRAEMAAESGDQGRATAIRSERATLRAEKLGDLEGAIARCEAAVAENGSDAAALRTLVDLYDKTGR